MQDKIVCKWCDKEIKDGRRVILTILSPSWEVKEEFTFHYECFIKTLNKKAWLLIKLAPTPTG